MRNWVQGFEGYRADLYGGGAVWSDFDTPGGQIVTQFLNEPMSVGESKAGWLSLDNGDLFTHDANFRFSDQDSFIVNLELGHSYAIQFDLLQREDFEEGDAHVNPDVVVSEALKASGVVGFQGATGFMRGDFVVSEQVDEDEDELEFEFTATSNKAIVMLRGPAFDSFSVEYTLSIQETGAPPPEPPEPEVPKLPTLVAPATGTPAASVYTGKRVEPRDGADDPYKITYYFIPNDEEHEGITSIGWNAYEKSQVQRALKEWADVTKLEFVETSDKASANFVLSTQANIPGAAGIGPFPDGSGGVQHIQFSKADDTKWSTSAGGGLDRGGYAFSTLVHEFGHSLGLGHPHDNGGGSEVMSGVTGVFPDYARGEFGLNDGAFSIMSYNTYYDPFYPHPNLKSGYSASPMPIDIAVAQLSYGANGSHGTGNTVYSLSGGGAGSYFSGIYDVGGSDRIEYSGSRDAVIDLRPASLKQEAGGGGYVSFVKEAVGGFTIAKGTEIESATAGSGDDEIIGNALDNLLKGNGGKDEISGGAGADTIMGDGGNDAISGGKGSDTIDGGGNDNNGMDLVSYKNSKRPVKVDLAAGIGRGEGRDTIIDVEAARGSSFNDELSGTNERNKLFGLKGIDILNGFEGSDILVGGKGNDTLIGGADRDLLIGGANKDTFLFEDVAHIGKFNNTRDIIRDFKAGTDKIDLSAIDARISEAGDQAFTFFGSKSYSGTAGELRFGSNDKKTIVAGDINGDGKSDFRLEIATPVSLTADDFIL